MRFSIDDEKAIKIDPKSFDMRPVLVAPKIEINGGVYLIPSEKVTYHIPTVVNSVQKCCYNYRRRLWRRQKCCANQEGCCF